MKRIGYIARILVYAIIHLLLLVQVSNAYWIGNVWSMKIPMLVLGFPLSLAAGWDAMDSLPGWAGFSLLGLNSLLWGWGAAHLSWKWKHWRSSNKPSAPYQ